jgi:hypothetical protein
MTHCLTCGAALDPDWCDVYCPPCLEQVYEDLAEALLTAFLSRVRGAILQRRVPKSEARWWLRTVSITASVP